MTRVQKYDDSDPRVCTHQSRCQTKHGVHVEVSLAATEASLISGRSATMPFVRYRIVSF